MLDFTVGLDYDNKDCFIASLSNGTVLVLNLALETIATIPPTKGSGVYTSHNIIYISRNALLLI